MAWRTSDSISLISALAAIASAIYTGMTYKATVALKKHDSILRLRLADETLRAAVLALPGLLERARDSRQAVWAAIGWGRSGPMQVWEARVKELEAEIQALQRCLPGEGNLASRSLEALTDLISANHSLQQRAFAVRDELNEGLRADDRQRDHLHEDHRAAMAARLAQPGR